MTTPPTLEDRLVISPGIGMVLAPSANLPMSFTLEFTKPLTVQLLYFPNSSVSISCNGNLIAHDQRYGEIITLKTSRRMITFELDYLPFTKEDRVIEIERERKGMNVDLIEQTAYRLIHGRESITDQVNSLFRYVHRIPGLGFKGHPYRSDKVIEWGVAKKCVDKAQLFVDLCRAVDIPARCEGGIRYLHKPEQGEYKYGHHAWASYDGGTQVQYADPSDGYLAQQFPRGNYFHTSEAHLCITGDKGYVSWKIHWKDTPQSLLRPSGFMWPYVKIVKNYIKSSRTLRV